MLSEFPNDSSESFQPTLRMVSALRHLNPPSGVSPLSIDRFSPYFDQSELIRNHQPAAMAFLF
jgi:hypothetical protein